MSQGINKYLRLIGIEAPKNETENSIFQSSNNFNEIEIDLDKINPFNIISEINEEKQKKVNKSDKRENYFKRMVLGAEIASQCYKERTFGSVKFQKLVFLCEHASDMEFSTNYTKQAAGPFDNKFMHSARKEFKTQKWFKIENKKINNFNKVCFEPMENFGNHKKFYFSYFNSSINEIQYVIDLLKKSYTNEVELVATIFACWLEIIEKRQMFSEKLIISKVYKWSKEKKKYTVLDISSKLKWMKEIGLTPVKKT